MRSCWRSLRRPWGRRARHDAAVCTARHSRRRAERTPQALSDIESLKAELEGARVDRKHKEEYEARLPVRAFFGHGLTPPAARQVLRKQCLAFPSRADTQAAIAGVLHDIAALEQESAATAATVEVRAQRALHGRRLVLSLRHRFLARSSGNSSSGTCSRAWTSSRARWRRTALCSRFPLGLRRCKWTHDNRPRLVLTRFLTAPVECVTRCGEPATRL